MQLLILSKNDRLNINKSKDTNRKANRKLLEETGEVLEAETFDERALELCDVIQVAINELDRMDMLEDALEEHNRKLLDRGWEFKKIYNITEG